VSTEAPSRGYLPVPAQSWLVLFFDLAFVAAIVVVSAFFARDYSLGQVAWLGLVFAMIWTTWLMTTMRMARSPVTRLWPRVLIVAQMALVLLMAITSNDFVEDEGETVGAVFGLILITAILMNRALCPEGDPMRLDRSEMTRLITAIVLFLSTWFVPDETVMYAAVWLVGLGLALSTVRDRAPWDSEIRHTVSHRFGEFTIIMLGESFLKVALVAGEEPLEELDLFALPLIFCVITALWWLYFAHVARAGVPAAHRAWVLTHFPLHLFIVGLAVGLSKLLVPTSTAYTGSAFGLIAVPLVGALVCLGVLIRLGGGPYARRGLRATILGSLAIIGVVILNYLGQGVEFDLAGTVLLVAIILAVVVRSIGPNAPRDPVVTGDGHSDMTLSK
jgi:low temperature requirement protein LtrA